MRILPEFLNLVVFVCMEREDEGEVAIVPEATGFWVAMSEHGYLWRYIVTARHVVENYLGDKIYLRANSIDGPYVDLLTRRADWFIHDSADVAVTLFDHRHGGPGVHVTATPVTNFVSDDGVFRDPSLFSDEFLSRYGGIKVEVGNEIFITGLFQQMAGRTQNLPIARFGNVSRLPDEPILLKRSPVDSFKQKAFLVECRSWGGHSGSPVFWTYEYFRPVAIPSGSDRAEVAIDQRWLVGLLGLVSAHFDIPAIADTSGDILGKVTMALNSGIAVVTPAAEIVRLLAREDLAADRAARAAARPAG